MKIKIFIGLSLIATSLLLSHLLLSIPTPERERIGRPGVVQPPSSSSSSAAPSSSSSSAAPSSSSSSAASSSQASSSAASSVQTSSSIVPASSSAQSVYIPPAESSSTETSSKSSSSKSSKKTVTGESVFPPENVDAEIQYNDDKDAYVVIVKWEESKTPDIDGLVLYRSTDPDSGFEEIAQMDPDAISYVDEDFEVGKDYYYYLKAVKKGAKSEDSNEAHAALNEGGNNDSTEDTTSGSNFWNIALICGAVGLIILLAAFGIILFLRKKHEKEDKSKGKKVKAAKNKSSGK